MRQLSLFVILFLYVVLWGAESSFDLAPFGKITVYEPERDPDKVILFISGDGGWNKGVVDMARILVKGRALVAGVDINRYLKAIDRSKEKRPYPAVDFENLSKVLQRRYNLSAYHIPVLVGYSSGATLAYALLAEAPPNTFAGGISLGFCPDLAVKKDLQKGHGLEYVRAPVDKVNSLIFKPVKELINPWVALQGMVDKVCDAAETAAFVESIKNAEVVALDKVGHGFGVRKNWESQFTAALSKILTQSAEPPRAKAENAGAGTLADADVSALPLVELPAGGDGKEMVVILTGDGGWASIDRELGHFFVRNGMPVVGFNSLKYFWKARTPAETASDVQKVIEHYLKLYRKEKVLLVGYSFGADVLPFVINALSAPIRERLRGAVCLSGSTTAEFEFHVSGWFGGGGSESYKTIPEIAKIKGTPLLLINGREDEQSMGDVNFDRKEISTQLLSGGHHFNGDYDTLGTLILQWLAKLGNG